MSVKKIKTVKLLIWRLKTIIKRH